MKTSFLSAAAIILTAVAPAQAGSKSWSSSGGNPSTAAYAAGCTVSATGSTSSYNVSGSAYADVAILGSGYKRIASASAGLTGTKTSVGINGRLDFAGGNIYNYSRSLNVTSLSMDSSRFNKTFSPPISPFFLVGPVKVTVKPSISVALSTSGNINYSTATQKLTSSISPATFDCSGGVTASVAAGLVSVNGSLTLCRVAPTESGSCDFKNRILAANASVNYSTLGGKISLKAGWSVLSYNLDIISWNGWSTSQNLFSESVRF